MKYVICVLLFASNFLYLYSQDGFPGMTGSYDDLRFLPPQNRQKHDFSFVRLVYNGRIQGFEKNWYTDYPAGDRTIIEVIRRVTGIDIAREERAIPICHLDLFNYPFVYSSEGGQMVINENDARRMREYLNRGGFWMIDDFWGTFEWDSFEKEIKKIFPDRKIFNIPLNHPIFHIFYDVEEIMQVPNIGYAYTSNSVTWEQDGKQPFVRGIFDGDGRLMVVILFNTDTMDAAEWANDLLYPHKYSVYAYKIFINTIVYAMAY